MNKSNIITLPHESLRKRSQRVKFLDAATEALIEDMKLATLDWEDSREHEVGVALAAVQVDKLYRVVIVRDDFNDKKNQNFDVFIDPEIVKYEGEIEEDYEGCLSVKDVYGKVPRHSKVRVKAMSVEGKEIRIRAEGFLARVFQHEIDHTNGILFVDHIRDSPEAFHKLASDGSIKKLSEDERTEIYKEIF